MKYEILAPAGDFESLKAAINNGADAVYLGLSNFNARRRASNFDESNIRDAVKLAHLFGVKVYITVNTLVKDEEYKELIKTVKCAVDAKADAYLVQDLGVLKVLKENFKGLTLHASTQMGVNNLYGAEALERLGFQRVVLARETRIEDIRLIHEKTNLEIEYFVQGALCISYSGNCYLSAFENGNSGNRGKCKQLCRFEYTDSLMNRAYFLSARDQALIKNMKELMDAGVTSFKIEGRLRHEGYVATAASIYKNAVDSILNNKDFNINDAVTSLKETYSRGNYLYDSYLYGTPDSVVNKSFQNHRGIEIGKVISCHKFKDLFEITISSSHELNKGDGLKFIKNNKETGSIGVGNVNKINENTYNVYSLKYIEKDSKVCLILNASKENDLLTIKRKLKINAKVKARVNEPLYLELSYNDVSYKEASDFILPSALTNPVKESDLYSSINRLNDEPFEIGNIEYDLDKVFIPKSVVNDVRRKALSSLKEKITEYNEKDIGAEFIKETVDTYPPEFEYHKKIVIFDDGVISLLKPSEKCLYIYSPSVYAFPLISNVFVKLKEAGISEFGLNQPVISLSEDLKVIDKLFKEYPDMVLLGNNVSSIHYLNLGRNVIISHNLNSFSIQSLKMYKSLGALNVVSSIESNKNYLDAHRNIYAYTIGHNTLMNFAHCPYKTVNGNTCDNCSFNNKLSYSSMRIRRYQEKLCQFELLNKNPLNVSGLLKNNELIDLREFKKEEVDSILSHVYSGSKVSLKNETEGLINRTIE